MFLFLYLNDYIWIISFKLFASQIILKFLNKNFDMIILYAYMKC